MNGRNTRPQTASEALRTYCKRVTFCDKLHSVPKSKTIGELLVIPENTENYKDGKVVADHEFPIPSVRIFYLGRAFTALHNLHYQK
jgi:hypothetical protein